MVYAYVSVTADTYAYICICMYIYIYSHVRTPVRAGMHGVGVLALAHLRPKVLLQLVADILAGYELGEEGHVERLWR